MALLILQFTNTNLLDSPGEGLPYFLIVNMSEFPEPTQESTEACEKRDIRTFRNCPKQMTTILTFHYLKNPDVEALSF